MNTSLRSLLALSIFVVVSIAHARVSHRVSERLVDDLDIQAPSISSFQGVGVDAARVTQIKARAIEKIQERVEPVTRALRTDAGELASVDTGMDSVRMRATLASSGVDVP